MKIEYIEVSLVVFRRVSKGRAGEVDRGSGENLVLNCVILCVRVGVCVYIRF